jgi:hypothetical protein
VVKHIIDNSIPRVMLILASTAYGPEAAAGRANNIADVHRPYSI